MNKKLQYISQKVGDIQFGLLRVMDGSSRLTFQVKTSAQGEEHLNCVVTDDVPRNELINKNVNLIQKSKGDYLYITGQVSQEVHEKTKILSIKILKACWYVRRSKGSVSWLKEKYIYDNFTPQIEMAS